MISVGVATGGLLWCWNVCGFPGGGAMGWAAGELQISPAAANGLAAYGDPWAARVGGDAFAD